MGEQTATRYVFRSSFSAIITGTGFEVPKRVTTNAELEKLVDTSDEWITERTGVKERHIAGDNQASSDLGLVVARLEAMGLGRQAEPGQTRQDSRPISAQAGGQGPS